MNNWSVGNTYSGKRRKRKGGDGWLKVVIGVAAVIVVAVPVVILLTASKGKSESEKPKGDDTPNVVKPQQPDDDDKTEVKPSEPIVDDEPSTGVVEVTDTIKPDAKGYLKIEQWGVAFKTPAGANYLIYYWLTTDKVRNDTLNVSADEDGKCSMGGKVVKSASEELAGATVTTKAGDYYYHVVLNSEVCSSKYDEAFQGMIQKLVLIEKN